MTSVTASTILEAARKFVKEISSADLSKMLENDQPTIFDIRDSIQKDEGLIKGALSVGQRYIELDISNYELKYNDLIVVYCAGGRNSILACKALSDMGYNNVYSLKEGFSGWVNYGGEVVKPDKLSSEEINRYKRHLSLPKIGYDGQLKLKKARVGMVGAGGLGSPIGLYLAAAGVGYIRIIDGDSVEESNLQRQIIHNSDSIGLLKVDSAADTIKRLNRNIKVDARNENITSLNARELLKDCDIIIDGSDNFDTRYIVNEATVFNKQILVSASIFQFNGQVSSFNTALGTPCYQCLFPERPPASLSPSCSSAGVIGALAGTIGLFQAMEVLKIILGIGTPLYGKLLTYDGFTSKTELLKYLVNPNCSVCNE